MLLPGRLRDTTLGDLLGTLLRARATGRLSLIDGKGQVHDIVLRDGRVHEVTSNLGPRLGDLIEDVGKYGPEAARAALRLGEYLVRHGKVSQDDLSRTLGTLHLLKLEQLFQLSDATIRFHVVRPARSDEVAGRLLESKDVLPGRPRKRGPEALHRRAPSRGEALQVLGLEPGATRHDIQQAFRRLAHRYHPDRHPEVSAVQKAKLMVQFSHLTHAYHTLLG